MCVITGRGWRKSTWRNWVNRSSVHPARRLRGMAWGWRLRGVLQNVMAGDWCWAIIRRADLWQRLNCRWSLTGAFEVKTLTPTLSQRERELI